MVLPSVSSALVLHNILFILVFHAETWKTNMKSILTKQVTEAACWLLLAMESFRKGRDEVNARMICIVTIWNSGFYHYVYCLSISGLFGSTNKFNHGPLELSLASGVWTSSETLKLSRLDSELIQDLLNRLWTPPSYIHLVSADVFP